MTITKHANDKIKAMHWYIPEARRNSPSSILVLIITNVEILTQIFRKNCRNNCSSNANLVTTTGEWVESVASIISTQCSHLLQPKDNAGWKWPQRPPAQCPGPSRSSYRRLLKSSPKHLSLLLWRVKIYFKCYLLKKKKTLSCSSCYTQVSSCCRLTKSEAPQRKAVTNKRNKMDLL